MRALLGGFAGAAALTILHEAVRKTVPDAPRLDLVGMRALRPFLDAEGVELRVEAMAGDLIVNSLYFSLAGLTGAAYAPGLGAALGAAAGAGSLLLVGPLGLGEETTNATVRTEALTLALYTVGGLIAGCVVASLEDPA